MISILLLFITISIWSIIIIYMNWLMSKYTFDYIGYLLLEDLGDSRSKFDNGVKLLLYGDVIHDDICNLSFHEHGMMIHSDDPVSFLYKDVDKIRCNEEELSFEFDLSELYISFGLSNERRFKNVSKLLNI